MSDSSRAIFLSYAREDAGAARRIAEALRASGLEVWFDESELRGGDTWDAKIRKQIDECALFIPIISQHTQERSKGYFRLEWKLAVDQTHLLAAGVPFVTPVVVDATKESEAVVPPEFMRVHWTRLPDGLPTPGFVDQIRRLLDRKSAGAPHEGTRSPIAQTSQPTPAKNLPGWLIPSAVGLVVAVGVFLLMRKPDAAPAAGEPKAENRELKTATTPGKPAVADKSIAVLPFTNMSEDKDNAIFTDGVHEDILTNLALIRELRVVSRTTVQGYRGTSKPIKQIAQELGVTYVLEGSVRRVGNKVRVTGQLIHASSDEHVWAQTYDRDLNDIFALQSELSQQIAGALKAALSPEEKILLARKPTENPAAYDLFVRARDILNREGNAEGPRSRQIALLEKAVQLDPNFAQAWAELAAACAYWNFSGYGGGEERMVQAKAAIETAMKLAPDDPEIFGNLGTYYYYGFRDYAKAAEQYERRAKLQPNAAVVFNSLGLIQRRQGEWAKSLPNSRRATELDPANLNYLRNLEATLRTSRRWDEFKAIKRKIVDFMPDSLFERYEVAYIDFQATGSIREVEEFFSRLSPADRDSSDGIELRRLWASSHGDFAEAVRLDKLQPYYDAGGEARYVQACFRAVDYLAVGDVAGARARLEKYPAELRAQLEREPRNHRIWAFLGLAEVVQGNREEALRCVERAVELLPESRDSLDGSTMACARVLVYDWTGEKEKALAEYARLLRRPTVQLMNVHELNYGYSTLHGDPRFEALLKDPKNNAPLF